MADEAFKLDYREFNATLAKYRDLHHNRTAPEIVNKKALFIARGAIRQTPRPGPTVIGRALSKIIYNFSSGKKKLATRTRYDSNAKPNDVPVAALIINYRRGKQGKKGLRGSDMKEAINKLVARANNARAFLASGWIPAIKKLTPLVKGKQGMPPDDQEAKKIKSPFGRVKPATSGIVVKTLIANDSLSRFTTTPEKSVFNKAAQALQRAIDTEKRSMQDHIKEEMLKAAKDCGIKAK